MVKNDTDIQVEKALIDLSEMKNHIYKSGGKIENEISRGTNGLAPTLSTGLSQQNPAPMLINHGGGFGSGA
jgi:hypothetical protein